MVSVFFVVCVLVGAGETFVVEDEDVEEVVDELELPVEVLPL